MLVYTKQDFPYLRGDEGESPQYLLKFCLFSPNWKNFPNQLFIPLHQRLISHYITIFMLRPNKNLILSCSHCSSCIYHFYFNFMLYVQKDHANFDFT